MKPTLFILEGPDCTGKSTLATHLCRFLPAVYMHASGDKSLHHSMLAYHQSLTAGAKVNLYHGKHVVLDRHWPSEYVYGQIFRPELSDRVYDFELAVSSIQSLDPIYIFCGDDESHIRHQKEQDPTHPYTMSHYETVCAGYRELESEMASEAALPLFNPKRSPYKFKMHHYNVLIDGRNMDAFMERICRDC